MIPISLTLQGIYSYKEKAQTIDFTNLCNAGLFGIFGSVGSGKSTILEAISYALYGNTERLNSHEKRNYNMMNLKSNSILIDFKFRNIKDDKMYRFVVKGKRNSKKFEDVKAYARDAFVKTENEWLKLQSANAEHIIGLSYENFRRTIIIPQGKFQEFLQLKDSERTKMMKELFQLHKFDFSDKTKRIEQENNTKRNNIEGQLQQLENQKDVSQQIILSPEQEAEIKKFRDERQRIGKELKLVRRNLRADIDRLGNTIKFVNMLVPSLLVCIGGIGYILWRHKRRRQN